MPYWNSVRDSVNKIELEHDRYQWAPRFEVIDKKTRANAIVPNLRWGDRLFESGLGPVLSGTYQQAIPPTTSITPTLLRSCWLVINPRQSAWKATQVSRRRRGVLMKYWARDDLYFSKFICDNDLLILLLWESPLSRKPQLMSRVCWVALSVSVLLTKGGELFDWWALMRFFPSALLLLFLEALSIR